jgi:hypothetical protein
MRASSCDGGNRSVSRPPESGESEPRPWAGRARSIEVFDAAGWARE